MKSFLKRKWHRLPVGIITVILLTSLVAGSVFAATPLITTDQIVTQTLVKDYGTITAPAIVLTDVRPESDFSQTLDDYIIVELGPDGVGQEFRMSATPSDLYTSFNVTITLIDKPEGSEVGLYGYGISGGGVVGIQLDVAGTYTFEQTVSGTAGSDEGKATSTVHFALVEYEGPPPPPSD